MPQKIKHKWPNEIKMRLEQKIICLKVRTYIPFPLAAVCPCFFNLADSRFYLTCPIKQIHKYKLIVEMQTILFEIYKLKKHFGQ